MQPLHWLELGFEPLSIWLELAPVRLAPLPGPRGAVWPYFVVEPG